MSERSQREREKWNDGIERQAFENLWAHSGAYWGAEVDRLLREVLLPRDGGNFLEIGTHTWTSWVNRLGLSPQSIDCINISETELGFGVELAKRTRVKPRFTIADAHHLCFADESFDVVFGKAILHHLDYAIALSEIRRVLRPNGVMVFMEPLNFNPVMRLVRHLTPDLRTPDEAPIAAEHIELFTNRFNLKVYPVEFTSAAVSPISCRFFRSPQNWMTKLAFSMDQAFAHMPGIQMWFRSALLVGSPRQAA